MYYKIRYGLGRFKLAVVEFIAKKLYLAGLDTQNLDILLSYRNRYEGQRCFVMGNAPSLNEMDLRKLSDERVFVCNGAYELAHRIGFKKSMLVIEDRLVMADHYNEVNTIEDMPIFIPSDLKKFIRSDRIVETFFCRSFDENSPEWPPFVSVNQDRPVFYWGGTVAYLALELAAWMGFSEIYIIGVDLDYVIPESVVQKGSVLLSTADDPNHYSKDYFGPGKRWHVPRPDRMLSAFEQVARREAIGRRIYNAGVGGKLDCFERIQFEKLF